MTVCGLLSQSYWYIFRKHYKCTAKYNWQIQIWPQVGRLFMLNQVNRKFSLHNKRTQRNIFATFFASMILTATIVLYVLHLMSFIRWCTESHANMQIKGKTWACFLLTSTNAFIFVEGQMIFGGIFLEIDTFCVVVYFNNNDEFKFNCLL